MGLLMVLLNIYLQVVQNHERGVTKMQQTGLSKDNAIGGSLAQGIKST